MALGALRISFWAHAAIYEWAILNHMAAVELPPPHRSHDGRRRLEPDSLDTYAALVYEGSMVVKLKGVSRHLSCKAPKLSSEISESSDLSLIEAGSGAHPIGQISEHAEMVKGAAAISANTHEQKPIEQSGFPFSSVGPKPGITNDVVEWRETKPLDPRARYGRTLLTGQKVEYYENNAGNPDSEVVTKRISELETLELNVMYIAP
jgi:hypothetical protein